MQKSYIDYELADGTTGTVRVLALDKVKMERTVRANQWPLEDGPRTSTLILFFVLQREGRITSSDYDAFIENELVDFAGGEEPTEENPI